MSTEIAVVDQGAYLALNHTTEELREVIAQNIGTTQLTERNLPSVKIPSGGGLVWQIPTPFGPESADELRGIVVSWKRVRAYWTNPEPTGEPPVCVSHDTILGIGEPGGSCKACPLSKFGTGKDGRGQACKEREIWFLLREDGFLPTVLSLPATSLKGAEDYRISLASGNVPLASVVTTVTLRSEKGPAGAYSIAVPKFGARLTDADRQAALAYARDLRPLFEQVAAEMAAEDDRAPQNADAVDLDADPADGQLV